MCRAQNLGSHNQGQGHNRGQRFVTYKLCVHNNSKTAEVNLIKFNTMLTHNETVCCAQNLCSHDQGHRFIPYKLSIHNNSKRAKQIKSYFRER